MVAGAAVVVLRVKKCRLVVGRSVMKAEVGGKVVAAGVVTDATVVVVVVVKNGTTERPSVEKGTQIIQWVGPVIFENASLEKKIKITLNVNKSFLSEITSLKRHHEKQTQQTKARTTDKKSYSDLYTIVGDANVLFLWFLHDDPSVFRHLELFKKRALNIFHTESCICNKKTQY